MADVNTLIVNGVAYTIVDEGARQLIAQLGQPLTFVGITTTALTDGNTTNPIIVNGESITVGAGGVAVYQSKEFIWTGSAWQEFGDLTGLGLLAYKNSASGSYTPNGTISAPTITLTGSDDVDIVSSISGTPISASYASGTVIFTNLTVSTESTPTSWEATATAPTFTGTTQTITVS